MGLTKEQMEALRKEYPTYKSLALAYIALRADVVSVLNASPNSFEEALEELASTIGWEGDE